MFLKAKTPLFRSAGRGRAYVAKKATNERCENTKFCRRYVVGSARGRKKRNRKRLRKCASVGLHPKPFQPETLTRLPAFLASPRALSLSEGRAGGVGVGVGVEIIPKAAWSMCTQINCLMNGREDWQISKKWRCRSNRDGRFGLSIKDQGNQSQMELFRRFEHFRFSEIFVRSNTSKIRMNIAHNFSRSTSF